MTLPEAVAAFQRSREAAEEARPIREVCFRPNEGHQPKRMQLV